jgi:hypothetical protein
VQKLVDCSEVISGGIADALRNKLLRLVEAKAAEASEKELAT